MRPTTYQIGMLLAGMLLLASCAPNDSHDAHESAVGDHGHGHAHGDDGHGHSHGVSAVRGPQGGRLYETPDASLELCILEADGPPIFVGYLYNERGERMSVDGAELTVTLLRFADRGEVITFTPIANHLRADDIVAEPHSFRAEIEFIFNGESHQFEFEQHAFRIELTQAAVDRAGILSAPAEPGHIDVSVSSPGEVRLNAERALVVRPRFPGIVTKLHKRLGDEVREGEVLAVIQSNTSLTEYSIKAPMAGHIVARSGMVGAAVDHESVLYRVADLSSVWVDFAIYPQHVGVITRGQPARITAATRPDLIASGEVSYVGPLLEQDTRVSQGRIVLPNDDGRWQPGLYVNVDAIVDHADVDIAVPDAAIVRSQFGPAVFLSDGPTFEIQPVTVGRSDGMLTEIVAGLEVGAMIVVENAYLLKAELGRAEATHDH